MNYKYLIGSLVGNGLSVAGVALTETQLQTAESIVAIICMVLGLLITITCSIILPLIKWWKKAKEDGKITADEIQEAQDILEEGMKDLKDKDKKGE